MMCNNIDLVLRFVCKYYYYWHQDRFTKGENLYHGKNYRLLK